MDESELHPDARAYLERSGDAPPLHTLGPEAAREFMREMAVTEGDPEPVESVHDEIVRGTGHGVPVRIYVPEADGAAGPLPALVWAHGGGFVLGDLETADDTARALANAGECVVVSVDYRLAPEHPFPAPQRDVHAATAWAAETIDEYGGDPDRLAVGGDSAGGGLAAAVTLMAREAGGPAIDYQVLVYPTVNYSEHFESYDEFADSFLGTDVREWIHECYLPDPLAGYNPMAYPLEGADFSGLPDATVLTVGYDPLRDEGRAYADALAAAGATVEHRHVEDVIHGFLGNLNDPEWERSREAVGGLGDDLQSHFGH